MELLRVDPRNPDPSTIARAADVIRRGGRFEPLRALEVLLGFAEPLTELVDGLEVGP